MSQGEVYIKQRAFMMMLFAFILSSQTFVACKRIIRRDFIPDFFSVEAMITLWPWLLMIVLPLLVFVLATSNGKLTKGLFAGFDRRARAVADDELVQVNRNRAFIAGSLVMLVGTVAGGIGAWGWLTLPAWWPVVLIGVNAAVTLASFGLFELHGQWTSE